MCKEHRSELVSRQVCVAAEAVRDIVDFPGEPVRSKCCLGLNDEFGDGAGYLHKKWAFEDGGIGLSQPTLCRGTVSLKKDDVVRLDVAL